MASGNTGNLFGEDTDSSDESVLATQPPSQSKIANDDVGDDDSSDDDAPKKQAAAAGEEKGETKDDESIREDTKANDSGEEVEEKASDTVAAATPGKNSALFGDDDDSSEDDEFDGDDGIVGRAGGAAKSTAAAAAVGRSMNQKLGLDSDSDDDKEGTKRTREEEAKKKWVPPRKMELLNLSSTDNKSNVQPTYHITKLPNLVGINATPYNAVTHDVEKEEEHYKGYVHNMIRWRYKTDEEGEYVRDEHGNPARESNTRVVKWSDGSFTLHIGTEVLAVDNLDSSIPQDTPDEVMAGFAGINGYLYVSQKAQIRPPSKKEFEGPPKDGEEEESEEEDSKPPAQPAGTVLECIGQIASRLAPRPSSLTSDAHRNLTLAMRQRTTKRARIAEIVTEVDPEKEKLERIKGKDDLAKSRARSNGGGKRSGGGGGRRRGMNASYLEEEEDYDGVNLSRMKRNTMRRDRYSDEEMDDYGDDDSEEVEDEWSKQKKKKRGAAAARASSKRKSSKGGRDEDDESSGEEGEVVFGDDDDDDEEDTAFVKKRGGGAKKAVFDDDDDD